MLRQVGGWPCVGGVGEICHARAPIACVYDDVYWCCRVTWERTRWLLRMRWGMRWETHWVDAEMNTRGGSVRLTGNWGLQYCFFQDLAEHQYIYLDVPFKTPHCLTFLCILVEGVVHPEMKIINPNVFQNLYDLLSVEHKRRCLVGCSRCSFPYYESKWKLRLLCSKNDKNMCCHDVIQFLISIIIGHKTHMDHPRCQTWCWDHIFVIWDSNAPVPIHIHLYGENGLDKDMVQDIFDCVPWK